MANRDPKSSRPTQKAPPTDESKFIGHDAPTMVDVSIAELKAAYDAKKAKAAPAPKPPPAAEPTNMVPSLESRTVGPVKAIASEEESSTGEEEALDGGEGEGEGAAEKLTTADLEALTKLKLPLRLKTFFDKEAAKYEGWYCGDLDVASSLGLHFLAGELPVYWEFATDGYFEGMPKKLMPIAACGDGDGTFFVAVDAGHPRLRTFFFDYEEGFKEAHDTFDLFLKSLSKEAPEDTGGGDDDDSESESESDGDDEASEQKLGPGGRPVDRFGEEWDYVTSEGMGFNDTDGEDEQSFEKNGKTYFKPDWGEWSPKDWVGFWKKTFAIEKAQGEGEDEYDAEIKKQGLRNRKHLERVRNTFMRHYAKDKEFTDAALEARQAQTRDAMKDAVKPGTLDPVEGVSLQVYASIQAQRPSLGVPEFKKLLAQHKIDEAKFARVDAEWLKRMSDQSDPMAAMAIATEYGKAFAGAGVGQFGASAQGASGSMGINDKVAGKKVKGGEPCTFEKYVEIMAAQSVWSTQGKDVNAMLKQVFKITAVDFSNMSAFWGQRMSTDVKLMTEVYPGLDKKYRERYSAGGGGDPDGDLDV